MAFTATCYVSRPFVSSPTASIPFPTLGVSPVPQHVSYSTRRRTEEMNEEDEKKKKRGRIVTRQRYMANSNFAQCTERGKQKRKRKIFVFLGYGRYVSVFFLFTSL